MSHFIYPAGTPLGTVPAFYVVPSTDWQTTIRQVFKAINGDEGGTWAPSAFITVGGSGFQFTGTGHTIADGGRLRLAGTGSGDAGKIDLKVVSGVALIDAENGSAVRIKAGASLDVFGTLAAKSGSTSNWESGATATLASGATLNVAGAVNFNSGANVAVKSGSTWAFQSGATVTLATGMTVTAQITVATGGNVTLSGSGSILGGSGSTVTLQGENNLSSLTLVGSDTWPELSTDRTVTRPAVRAIPLTFNNGANTVGPDDPDMWECRSSLSAAPAFRSRSATASGKSSILEVLDLPIGAIITGAEIDTRGTEPTSIASTLPTYQVVSWSSGEGGLASHSGATADAGLALNFGLVTASTTVGNTGDAASRTVVAGRRYGILVTHPYQSSVGQGAEVYRANILASVGSIQI